MGVMSLGIGKDADITIIVDGNDEELAMNELTEVITKEGLAK